MGFSSLGLRVFATRLAMLRGATAKRMLCTLHFGAQLYDTPAAGYGVAPLAQHVTRFGVQGLAGAFLRYRVSCVEGSKVAEGGLRVSRVWASFGGRGRKGGGGGGGSSRILSFGTLSSPIVFRNFQKHPAPVLFCI